VGRPRRGHHPLTEAGPSEGARTRFGVPPRFREPAALLIVAVAIVSLSWPFRAGARTGLDPSWQAALHLAGPAGLRFGTDLVFTLGPLGFLAAPTPIFGWSSVLAVILVGLLSLATAATLVVVLRRLLPLWAAALAALAIARLAWLFLPPFEMLQIVVAIWAVEACFSTKQGPLAERWLPLGSGVIAAIALLGKVNIGLFLTAILTATIVGNSRTRLAGAATFLGSLALSLLVLWLATGQTLDGIVPYVVRSIEVIRGYSASLVLDAGPDRDWVPGLVAGALVAAAIVGWTAMRRSPGGRVLALAAVGAILGFAEWKTAFARYFPLYALVTIGIVTLPLAARLGPTLGRAIAFACVGLIAFTAVAIGGMPPARGLDVGSSLSAVRSVAARIAPWNVARSAETTSRLLRSGLALTDPIVAALAGQTVHVDGWQTTVLAAVPEARWRPLPVFQSYQAYTTALDEINADALRRGPDPSRIVREHVVVNGEVAAVDHHFPWFETPATTLEMLCRYREILANERWEVLARTNSACAPAERLSSTTARAGEHVAVPSDVPPGRFLVVRVRGFPDGVLDRLGEVLYRAQEWWVRIDGQGRFRFLPATAADGLLLAVPDSIRMSPNFAFGPPITGLTITAGRFDDASDAMLTYDFESVPLIEVPS
jgi:hypothetical protein